MYEKRRHQRINVNLPVILRHCGRLLPATLINLSCGGMHLKTEATNINDGGRVEVIFDLGKHHRDLSMRGQITRVKADQKTVEVGIRFTNLFSLGHKEIQTYLQNNT